MRLWQVFVSIRRSQHQKPRPTPKKRGKSNGMVEKKTRTRKLRGDGEERRTRRRVVPRIPTSTRFLGSVVDINLMFELDRGRKHRGYRQIVVLWKTKQNTNQISHWAYRRLALEPSETASKGSRWILVRARYVVVGNVHHLYGASWIILYMPAVHNEGGSCVARGQDGLFRDHLPSKFRAGRNWRGTYEIHGQPRYHDVEEVDTISRSPKRKQNGNTVQSVSVETRDADHRIVEVIFFTFTWLDVLPGFFDRNIQRNGVETSSSASYSASFIFRSRRRSCERRFRTKPSYFSFLNQPSRALWIEIHGIHLT